MSLPRESVGPTTNRLCRRQRYQQLKMTAISKLREHWDFCLADIRTGGRQQLLMAGMFSKADGGNFLSTVGIGEPRVNTLLLWC